VNSFFRRINAYFRTCSKNKLSFYSFLAILLLGLIDHLSGFELAFSIFYTIPIAMSAWYCGRRCGLFQAFIGASVWLAADISSGHLYTHPLIPVWNALVRFCFFMIIVELLRVIEDKLTVVEQMAETDSLTGLDNSRSFYKKLQAESIRARRYGRPFTLVYLDLDNFKQINDSLGHQTGDLVLVRVAHAFRGCIRLSDVAGRLGGDEFAGFFPETDVAAAVAMLTKLRERLTVCATDNAWPLSLSIGAVTFEKPLDSLQDMITMADRLMYEVKKSGKNSILHKVCIGETPSHVRSGTG
jgi:diguanylate cyclase (GGDEF)-like protein